jgi:hypothetical protein
MRTLSAFLALLVCLTGTPARAEIETELDPPDLSRYLKWGPVRVRPRLEIKNVGYDSNIFVTEANKEGDNTATLVPKFEGLVLLGNRAFFEFDEQFEYTVYAQHSGLNFWNQRGNGRVTLPFDRFGFYVEGVLNYTRDRPVDQQDIRPRRDETGLELGMIALLGWRTEVAFSHLSTDWRHTDPDDPASDISARLDRTSTQFKVEAKYFLKGYTSLTLDATFGGIDFDAPLVIDNPAQPEYDGLYDKDSDDWSVLVGVHFKRGGPFSGEARIGHAVIDVLDPALTDLKEVVGNIDIAYRLASSTRLQLKAERRPGFTVSGSQTYFLLTSYEGRMIHFLNRRFGLEAGAWFGTLAFPPTFPPVAAAPREDTITHYDIGLRVWMGQNSMGNRVEYSFRIGDYSRDSNQDIDDLSRTTISVNAIIGF